MLATYFYDYQGRRSRKITTAAAPQGASTTIYTYDLYDRLKGELDGAGNPLRTYVWRDEVPVSIIQHGTPEKAWYLEVDHLNTPLAARDQTGKVIWQWASDAFGSVLPNEDPDGDGQKTTINLRFPGQYYDKESGLHYNHRRYYDPKLGRYLSPDPIGLAGGGNLYSYARQNPLSHTDPRGLNPVAVAGGVVLVGLAAWKGIEFLADMGQMLIRAEMATDAQRAADAASAVCQSSRNSGACNAAENFQRQAYQCTAAAARAGAAAAWNVDKPLPSSPIMPGWKPIP